MLRWRWQRLNLLMVTGDGARVRRVGIRPSAILASALLIALAAYALVTVLSDYVALRSQRVDFLAHRIRLHEQEAQLSVYQGRLRELHGELQGWREIRDRVWATFGPEAAPGAPGAGIGGVSAPLPHAEAVRDAPRSGAAPPATADSRQAIRDELERLTALVREEGEGLRSLQQFIARATRALAAMPSRWPLRGPINSDFGHRTSPWSGGGEYHGGIDIGAPVGTPVHAPAPGVVSFAGRHGEYGFAVIIDHGNDIRSLYGHLSRLHVLAGQDVQRGDLIASSGNTGRSSGPHLHYEIHAVGQAVNPHTFLWE